MTFYRTFNNIRKGGDLTCHTFLCELDKWKKSHNNKFPEELFIQIDGGSENANETVIALCEYLVAKRIIRSITLSRLPTGHTHEDIDACFAHVWRGMRQKTVHTVDDYAKEINTIFNGQLKASVKDLYVVSDFKAFFKPSIDTHFGRFAKELDSQHQFKFDAVEVNADFPLGVRTMYRAYCSDKVVEFTKMSKEQCLSPIGQRTGLEPHTLLVSWGPERASTVAESKKVVGFYILTKLPLVAFDAIIPPKDFQEGSLDSFAQTVREAKSKFFELSDICAAWEKWEKAILVSTESAWTAAEYVAAKPLLYQIPLLQYFRLEPHEFCSTDWTPIQPNFSQDTGSDFQWPEQLAAAVHSVTSQWQRDPMPSRIFLTMDVERRNVLKRLMEKAEPYYLEMKTSHTVDMLGRMLRERLDNTGLNVHITGSKSILLTRVKETDKDYLTILYKALTPENHYFLSHILHRPYQNASDGDEIKVTSNDGKLSLTRSQIRQFNVGQSLGVEVMEFLMNLMNERNQLMMDTHFRKSGNTKNYQPLKRNFFLMAFPNLAEIPTVKLEDMNKVFINFKQSMSENDEVEDSWVGLVVDFLRKAVYYVDPKYSGDVIITPPLSLKLQRYKDNIRQWMSRCNWIPPEPFECKLYPSKEHCFDVIQNNSDSGIYLTVINDMISHDCPRCFAHDDIYTFRLNLSYAVLNNYYPY